MACCRKRHDLVRYSSLVCFAFSYSACIYMYMYTTTPSRIPFNNNAVHDKSHRGSLSLNAYNNSVQEQVQNSTRWCGTAWCLDLGVSFGKIGFDGTHLLPQNESTRVVFEMARQNVRESVGVWPGFDSHSNSSRERVLVFTICSKPSVPVDGGQEIDLLCDAQLRGMQIWGGRQFVAFRQVRNVRILDESRAPHWQKVAYIHAFLREGWDVVFFLDADSMVADASWNIRSYIDSLLPIGSEKLFLAVDDTIDWHSTGEIICRQHTLTLRWLEDWYQVSEQFFGSLLAGESLRTKRIGLHSDPLDSYRKIMVSKDRHLVERRCSAFHRFHEQGCLNQFYSVSPAYLKNLVIVDANALRRMTLDNPGSTPIVHICCKTRQEQAADLTTCVHTIQRLQKC